MFPLPPSPPPAEDELVTVMVAGASDEVLRALLRQNVAILLGASLVLWVAFAMPDTPWGLGLVRWLLFAVALFVAGTKLLSINGINEERRRRQTLADPSRPDTPPRPDDAR